MVQINLRVIDECKSTNSYVINLAHQGYPEGFSLLSLVQLSGRGSRKKKWISKSGNLFLSTLIRPKINKKYLAQISIVFSWSLFEFLLSLGIENKIIKFKWPNDILISSKKISGVLVETFSNFSVIGVGLNINSFPSKTELGFESACLKDFLELKQLNLSKFSYDLLYIFYKNYNIWLKKMLNPFLDKINSNLAYVNKTISFIHNETNKTGKIVCLNPEGSLKVLLDNDHFVSLTSSETIIYKGEKCF